MRSKFISLTVMYINYTFGNVIAVLELIQMKKKYNCRNDVEYKIIRQNGLYIGKSIIQNI